MAITPDLSHLECLFGCEAGHLKVIRRRVSTEVPYPVFDVECNACGNTMQVPQIGAFFWVTPQSLEGFQERLAAHRKAVNA